MIAKVKAFLKAVFCKNDGTISLTKVGILVTSVCALVAGFPDLFKNAGLDVPAAVSHWAKLATFFSGILTTFRAKWDLEKLKDKVEG
jgi:hypothetical protein